MAKWNRTCKEFVSVRNMIYDGNLDGIINGLLNICEKYAKLDDDFSDDFDSLADDLRFLDTSDLDEEDCDFYLSEFYDLCDAARIWLDI